ncbi:uncharacterized protein LOC115572119 isoform X2 [Sparus aurata]|uniref:uncharacterized protein LOC115572119 isoform X2 n=1 Tax=Sparus aurata TaxID=8175 RepID=UPI0011C15E56|nr:uncharacterized protein LOC115572119 isoform X2 [Sparus aurata]
MELKHDPASSFGLVHLSRHVQQHTGFCITLSHCGGNTRYRYRIFGSGTKLFVTDEQVVKPVVSVYPAASRAPLEGRSSLLCVASAMFPPLVRISWERQEDQEQWVPAEGEQLELRESGCTAAILQPGRDALHTCKYRCSVQHEGGTVKAQTEPAAVQTTSSSITTTSRVPPTSIVTQPETAAVQTTSRTNTSSAPPTYIKTQPEAVSFQSQCRVKLLCVLYTVLIVKSLVYCCGLSLLRIL